MEQALVKIDPKDYGLQEGKAKEIEAVFLPMIEKMKELEKDYNEIIELPVSMETSIRARELRLRYVKIRTATAQIHKDAKAFYLAGGKFVDGWKNAQLYASHGMEDKLESIENHFEKIEQEKKVKLQAERMETYTPYASIVEGTPEPDFANMPDDIWNNFLEGAKKIHLEKIEAQKRAEEETRLAAEKVEKERLAKEKAEAEQREKIRLENEKLKKEKEQLEAEAKKREAYRVAKELAEKKERDRVEAELEAKKLKEAKEEKERLEKIETEFLAKKKAEQAPDKEKLKNLCYRISAVEIPEVNSDKAKTIRHEAMNGLVMLVNQLGKKIDLL